MELGNFIESFAWRTRDSVIVYRRDEADLDGPIAWCNDAFYAQFQYEKGDVEGQKISSLLLAESFQHLKTLVGQDTEFLGRHNFCCAKADGSSFWSALQLLEPSKDHSSEFCCLIIRDISEIKQREDAAFAALQQHEEMASKTQDLWSRLTMAIDAIDAPMGIWDKDLNLVICNRAFGPRLLGREVENPPNLSHIEFARQAAFSGNFVEAEGNEEAWIKACIESIETRHINDMTVYADGRTFLAKSELAPNGDMIVHNVDLTEALAQQDALREKNRELETARERALLRANRDDLTEIGNRRSIAKTIDELLELRERDGGDIAALQIDLDRFKQINDTLGHAAGDYVLRTVAARLRALVNDDESLARIGGDEFVIFLRHENAAHRSQVLAHDIIQSISCPIPYQERDLRVGVSIGIAVTPLSKPSELLVHADVALYRAKSSGRLQALVFDTSDLSKIRRKKETSDSVLFALDAGQFVPWYQPQIDAETGRIVGMEALARWDHPDRGILPPSQFIKSASDLHVVDEIDRQIFVAAIDECTAAFENIAPLDLSFNTSEQRLHNSEFNEFVQHASKYPGHVAVELLETIFFEDQDDSFKFQLDRLREAGIGIELDDFGSGRASIMALDQISPDRFKIDRSLVQTVHSSTRSARLLQCIIDISDVLQIPVTAEGIETKEQSDLLTAMGCNRLQGFYFGQPMPLSKIIEKYKLKIDTNTKVK